MKKYAYYKEKAVELILDIPEIITGKKDVDLNISNEDLERMNNIADVQLVSNLYYRAYYDILPFEQKKQQIEQTRDVNIKLNALLNIITMLQKKFTDKKISSWFIKGFALSKMIYGDLYTRDFNDIDLLVHRKDIENVANIMIDMGFSNDFDLCIFKFLDSLDCYEVDFFYPFPGAGKLSKKFNHKLSTELKIDTSSIRDNNLISHFKENSVNMDIGNVSVQVFSLNDTFILLCTNLYSNFEAEFAKAKIRDLFDVYFFINTHSKELDWIYISKLCNRFKIAHKLYAVFNFVNSVYNGFISEEIVKLFSLDTISYDSKVFHGFDHGRMRDWSVDPIDAMLSRDARKIDLFYEHCIKTYSSRNINYCHPQYISSLKDVKDNENSLMKGFCSKVNELEYSYQFTHDEENIYFTLKFEKYNDSNQMKTVLILFDIDRNSPRKMIEFFREEDKIVCNPLDFDFMVERISNSQDEITITMKKKSFQVLQNEGRMLGYRMYSVRKFKKIDYAILDELKTFDFENPKLLYLYSRLKRYFY